MSWKFLVLPVLAAVGVLIWVVQRPGAPDAEVPVELQEKNASGAAMSGARVSRQIPAPVLSRAEAVSDDGDDGEWDEDYPELTADDLMDPARLAKFRAAGKVAKANGRLRRPKGVPASVITHYDAAKWPKDARYYDADQLNDLSASTLTRDLQACQAGLLDRRSDVSDCSLKVFVHAVADGELGVVREVRVPAWPDVLDGEYRECLKFAYERATYPTLMSYDIWFLSEPCFR